MDPETKIEGEVISSENASINEIMESNSEMNTEETSNLNSSSIIEEGNHGSSQHRAKAFILNTENNDWEEMATGICSPEPSEVNIII